MTHYCCSGMPNCVLLLLHVLTYSNGNYSSNVSNETLALSWTVNIKVQILPCCYSVQLTRISILLKLVLPFSAIIVKESAQSPKFLIPESAATGMSDISRRVHSIKRKSMPESV